jgi:hypothetical protein
LIVGKNHAKLKAELANLASSLCIVIKTEAENITAFNCKSISSKTNVCNLKDVKALDDKI